VEGLLKTILIPSPTFLVRSAQGALVTERSAEGRELRLAPTVGEQMTLPLADDWLFGEVYSPGLVLPAEGTAAELARIRVRGSLRVAQVQSHFEQSLAVGLDLLPSLLTKPTTQHNNVYHQPVLLLGTNRAAARWRAWAIIMAPPDVTTSDEFLDR